ncbi:Rpn family recombination-promoting nuclease/putative transposase [Nostocaceae cyanobacterium CENA357]|uniref:Rpn family recombination-promoting nuclease/putative transposase n=1 Tax=Atlanticothrix silvestris CENA357 TaxID=1725252 RepID=A0A8J7L7L5_9CYAN|nr:Rpn family recombination-promoting nuclease/putative transposase [Atlanticothrix silvestris]MBH8555232.1 Rpn family recombination-promoting nuclease/putative transposase [Atlanticothrix silvestris CENA357]
MIDHDRLFKELISTFFVEFLDLFLPQIAKDIDRDEIQFLPQEVFNDVTSGEKKEIDLLAQVLYQQQETYFLIHIENQSYSQSEFAKRMFKYFSRLYEKYDLPIYPVVIFSFDEPKRLEPRNHRVTFPDLNVLDFNFAAIQLNQLSWRNYLTQSNPVAAALMSKMNIPKEERPQVKAECLRLLTTLKLDPARMQLISGFVDVYLNLNMTEEEVFKATVDRMGLTNEEVYMEIVTSWKREGLREGRQEERRASITKFLQLRFGEIDAQLEAIIPQLMELSTDEYMSLIYQASREDLLSRFHGES